jgi:hypothetical protein
MVELSLHNREVMSSSPAMAVRNLWRSIWSSDCSFAQELGILKWESRVFRMWPESSLLKTTIAKLSPLDGRDISMSEILLLHKMYLHKASQWEG